VNGFTGPWDRGAPPLGDHAQRVAQPCGGAHSSEPPGPYCRFVFVGAARDRGRINNHGARRKSSASSESSCTGRCKHHARGVRSYQNPHLRPCFTTWWAACRSRPAGRAASGYRLRRANLGSFADGSRAQSGLIDHVEYHPRIYIDTVGVRRFELLARGRAARGCAQVLFASNRPCCIQPSS
jgi:hypothetical protein